MCVCKNGPLKNTALVVSLGLTQWVRNYFKELF